MVNPESVFLWYVSLVRVLSVCLIVSSCLGPGIARTASGQECTTMWMDVTPRPLAKKVDGGSTHSEALMTTMCKESLYDKRWLAILHFAAD